MHSLITCLQKKTTWWQHKVISFRPYTKGHSSNQTFDSFHQPPSSARPHRQQALDISSTKIINHAQPNSLNRVIPCNHTLSTSVLNCTIHALYTALTTRWCLTHASHSRVQQGYDGTQCLIV